MTSDDCGTGGARSSGGYFGGGRSYSSGSPRGGFGGFGRAFSGGG